ncbi:MAG: hypothetical protein HSCHL_2049 [Hydrogenibacillus schlegelii]|uniref:Flp family type IVb pilin n=2 Tax=Hydrogenibacillus schlegelii TaxID=1484 RepID=A0A2T5G428_HYDSH|nr:MAG: hypothetical protein HSCHL_2049 [Hydrogenibacillus schlegelii]
MIELVRDLRAVADNESGQTMGEYGLLIALIAVAVIASAIFLGTQIAGKFKQVGTEIQNAQPVQ